MRTWLTKLWDDLRSGFWFLPTLLIAFAVLLALGMLTIDGRVEEAKSLPIWLQTSPPASRTTMSALAGALLTGASVVFSITMLVLAQTASQYGSRLMRTIADGNRAQITLGLLLGTSVYCLLILRSIRDEDFPMFVPHLSVAAGVLLGLGSLCALIFFLHETSSAMQAQTVARSVYTDLESAIDRLFPNPIEEADPVPGGERPRMEDAVELMGGGIGYLQAVDSDSLLEVAVAHDLVLQVEVMPGTFVTDVSTLAEVSMVDGRQVGELDDDLREQLQDCFLLGVRRTPRQDVVCAVDELVEVAVRALSPGINDPFTAMTCADYLGAALARLVGRHLPERHRRDDSGAIRVVVETVTIPHVFDAAVITFTHHAARTPSVVLRLVETLQTVASRIVREEDADALRSHVEWIRGLAEKRLDDELAIENIRSAVGRVEDELDRGGAA